MSELSSTTGLEQLRYALIERPSTGIAELMKMTIDHLEPGLVRFTVRPDETMTNPLGTVHGGIAATLLDSTASCAVHSALPAGATYATTQLNIHYIRAIRADLSPITGEGSVVYLGRSVATANSVLRNESGDIVAHGSVTCSVKRDS